MCSDGSQVVRKKSKSEKKEGSLEDQNIQNKKPKGEGCNIEEEEQPYKIKITIPNHNYYL